MEKFLNIQMLILKSLVPMKLVASLLMPRTKVREVRYELEKCAGVLELVKLSSRAYTGVHCEICLSIVVLLISFIILCKN